MTAVSNHPQYAVVIYERDPADLSPAGRIMEVNNPKNLGWADYLNDVPEAFFSLHQDDPQCAELAPFLGQAHTRIYRIDPATGERSVVWAGIFGTETDEQAEDMIFYSHGYLAALYWLTTDWDQAWDTVTIDNIISDVWTRAKTTIADSELEWIATGTIQAPATTSGGATPIILPVYTTYFKPILSVLRELSAVGRSDTTNATVFEITHSETPTFNFWGAKGADTNLVYEYGGSEVKDFWYQRLEAHRRNQIHAVGTSPRELTLRTTQSATPGLRGRRTAPIYLQWVRDQTELERVAKLRLAKANRNHFRLGLQFFPGTCIPPGMSFSPFDLADRVKVKIDKGATQINEMMLVIGVQVIYADGMEHVTLITETRTGS